MAHPEQPDQPLWLVVCRSQGRSPWYLLTAEGIDTDEQAWHVVFGYTRRWQIELSWEYEKSELAFQSPRVYEGEPREKLLLLATPAYAFLLTLLQASSQEVRLWLLRSYGHRTGLRARTAKLPLIRLRCAGALLVKSMQDPSSLARRPQVEHSRPLYASLPLRLAWILLRLARRGREETRSISAPARSSEDGPAHEGLQTES